MRDERREGRGVGFMQKRVGGKEERREERREKGRGKGDPSKKLLKIQPHITNMLHDHINLNQKGLIMFPTTLNNTFALVTLTYVFLIFITITFVKHKPESKLIQELPFIYQALFFLYVLSIVLIVAYHCN